MPGIPLPLPLLWLELWHRRDTDTSPKHHKEAPFIIAADVAAEEVIAPFPIDASHVHMQDTVVTGTSLADSVCIEAASSSDSDSSSE